MGKYEEALERAKAGKPLDEVFPELKESEDEKIRNEIISFFKDAANSKTRVVNSNTFAEWATYLEKQKEQNPNVELIQKSWYLEGYHDGKYNNEPKWLIQTGKGGPMYEENLKYGTQQPAEWSEEDEHYFQNLIMAVDSTFSEGNTKNWLQNRFKSLRPQPHWKPSEEQINALKIVARGFPADDPGVIDSLLADLQKLL